MLNVKGSSTYLPLNVTIIVVSLYEISEIFNDVPKNVLQQLYNRFEEYHHPNWRE